MNASDNVDTSLLESAVSEKTKAIMIAHTLGNPFRIGEVKRLADKYRLWLIEDTCGKRFAKLSGGYR